MNQVKGINRPLSDENARGSRCPRTESANLAGSEDEAEALEAERSAAKRCEAERFGYLSSHY
jgi:hypothetical protein